MSPTQNHPASAFRAEAIRINPPDYTLWDFAGVDGLQVAIVLFSHAVSHLAPFQSLTTEFSAQPCAVLRLCEGNFRVALPADIALNQAITELKQKVWVKQCSQTATLSLPINAGLELLPQIATTKPIHCLKPFPLNRAVPARIQGIALLAWHHLWLENPRLDIQTAASDLVSLRAHLQKFSSLSE